MSPVKNKMYDELCDDDKKAEFKEIYNTFIKHGDQYNILLVNTNANTKDKADKLILISPIHNKIQII